MRAFLLCAFVLVISGCAPSLSNDHAWFSQVSTRHDAFSARQSLWISHGLAVLALEQRGVCSVDAMPPCAAVSRATHRFAEEALVSPYGGALVGSPKGDLQ